MEKLLTKRDLAERWQVTTKSIDKWLKEGRLTPCKDVPGDMRFSPKYIAELEGIKLDKFSPLERKKMEREIEVLTVRAERAEEALARINVVISEAIYIKERGLTI